MSAQKTLAALVTLLNPAASDDQVRHAVASALKRAESLYAAPVRRPTVTSENLSERILTFLKEIEHYPSMRELLARVSGNRKKVHAVAKGLISQGILEVVKSGRSVGIKVK